VKTRSARGRVFEWLQRYGPAECSGITCALIASLIVRRVTASAVAVGYAGAWGEALGYGAVMVGRDFLAAARRKRAVRETFTARDGAGVVGSLLVEFGPASLIDTLLTRPLAMALGTRLLGLPLGVLVGKLAADALFYVPVIATYERTKGRGRGA
jgi:hypothetical protein